MEKYANQDVLRLTLSDGSVLEGGYIFQSGMHFIHVRDGSPTGKVEGPVDPEQITKVELVRAWSDIKAERLARSRGEAHPGRAPVTREDYEYRLQTLARAVASASDTRRSAELLHQFNDVADEIQLAQAKRAWVLAEGRHSLSSNSPATMEDLWFSDVASPSRLKRPRAQDFDPVPSERRKRSPLPDDILVEENSIPNMLSRLRACGLKATIALAGDPFYDRADIQVDLAEGRLHRFVLSGHRRHGRTSWRLKWAGNDTKAGLKRYRSITRTAEFQRLLKLVGGDPTLARSDRRPQVNPRYSAA